MRRMSLANKTQNDSTICNRIFNDDMQAAVLQGRPESRFEMAALHGPETACDGGGELRKMPIASTVKI